MGSEENLQKMKTKMTNLEHTYKQEGNLKGLQISFYTRYTTMEYCFGDIDNEEPNIAYSILKAVKSVSISS